MKCPYCKSPKIKIIHETNGICANCNQPFYIDKKDRPRKIKIKIKGETL